MHTFKGKNKTIIHYNSDLSGLLIINNQEVNGQDIYDFIVQYAKKEAKRTTKAIEKNWVKENGNHLERKDAREQICLQKTNLKK